MSEYLKLALQPPPPPPIFNAPKKLLPTRLFTTQLAIHCLFEVVEVTNTGVILRTYVIPKSGTYHVSLNRPCYVISDTSGSTYVCDRLNDRLMKLDPELKRAIVVITWQNQETIHWPRRICVVEEEGKLLVGLNTAVEIYRFKK